MTLTPVIPAVLRQCFGILKSFLQSQSSQRMVAEVVRLAEDTSITREGTGLRMEGRARRCERLKHEGQDGFQCEFPRYGECEKDERACERDKLFFIATVPAVERDPANTNDRPYGRWTCDRTRVRPPNMISTTMARTTDSWQVVGRGVSSVLECRRYFWQMQPAIVLYGPY